MSKDKKVKDDKASIELLNEAKKHLTISLGINNSIYFNQTKCIFILLLLSKCEYYCEEGMSDASNYLKEALLKFADLNKFIFEKNLDEQLDPRVMFVVNGVIIEQVLYQTAKICSKIGKKKLAAWVYNKLMEVSYFRSIDIEQKCCEKLYKFLFDVKTPNNTEQVKKDYIMPRKKLEKICNRFSKPKNVQFIISETLLKNFSSTYELREILLKCINNYMDSEDIISTLHFDYDVQTFINPDFKKNNFNTIKNNVNFCKYSNNLESKDNKLYCNLYQALDYGIDAMSNLEFENLTNPQKITQKADLIRRLDKYVYIFLYSNDFRFDSDEDKSNALKKLMDNEVSLIIFIFDDVLKPEKLNRIKENFLNWIIEGYVVHVKNFQIIEETFQNNAKKPKKNILGCNFDNFRYIY